MCFETDPCPTLMGLTPEKGSQHLAQQSARRHALPPSWTLGTCRRAAQDIPSSLPV